MAERPPEELGNVVSSLDMAAFLNDPAQQGESVENKDLFQDSLTEPELVVEGENRSEPQQRREATEIRGEEDSQPRQTDDRLDQALRTIDRLTGELETRRPQQQQEFTTQSIEWMDTPWGIQIPKDPKMRFVQLTSEHLEPLGIDGSIAPGLNILANAFWASIVNTIPQNTMRAMEEVNSRRNTDRERFTSFFDEYSDLKDHVELVQLLEHKARREENLHERFPQQPDYRREISRRVRSKIAGMRGISLDQYEREVGTSSSNNSRTLRRAPASRARSVGGGGGGGSRTTPKNDIFSDTLYGG